MPHHTVWHNTKLNGSCCCLLLISSVATQYFRKNLQSTLRKTYIIFGFITPICWVILHAMNLTDLLKYNMS